MLTKSFRVGELVEVRSASDILATLDESGSVDGLPFMPEMLQYCGKRYRIYKSAHKTCDTIESYCIRRMSNAVHLEGLRCDGQAHGGCQAACLLFWKTDWLKRVPSSSQGSDRTSRESVKTEPEVLRRATRQRLPDGTASEDCYRCQATELVRATTEVRRRERWNPFFYIRDMTSGNVRLRDFLWFGALATVNSFTLRWFGRRHPHLCGLAGKQTPAGKLDLQPGELVRVRSKDEIMKTTNAERRNRGLLFDVEMVRFCETGEFRVLQRVERILDERTGRMVKLANPNIVLEGVTCSGNISMQRMFCPRAIYPYWRELWLTRVERSTTTG